jgi:nucleoside-diphosphate-sugar epimerase
VLALWRGKPQRAYNINDDTALKMGDYFTAAAAWYGLPVPPRISRAQAELEIAPMQLSFMSESRRMVNTRMKLELGLRLHFPHVLDGLAASA